MSDYIPSITAIVHEDFKNPPSRLPGKIMAANLNKPYNTLIQELEGTRPTHKFAADLLLPIMRQTGSIRPLECLCEELGGAFVRLPAGSPTCAPAQQQCLIAVKEFGELMHAVGESLLDGTITTAEKERIHKEGYELISATLSLVRQIEAECGE